MVSPLHSQSQTVTASFDHLDALRMGLVEHLHVVDLPDKVPGPQTTGLRHRFLAGWDLSTLNACVNMMIYDSLMCTTGYPTKKGGISVLG